MSDRCFICFEEDDLHSHCRCALKVHKKCLTALLKRSINSGKHLHCSVCNFEYECKVKKSIQMLSINLLMLSFTLLLFIDFICFFINIKLTVVSDVSFTYIFILCYIVMLAMYKKHTDSYIWFKLNNVDVEYDVHTNNNFSVTVVDTYPKFIKFQSATLHISLRKFLT